MMYNEFIELIGGEKISCEDYQKVETVYMYHPLIGEVEPKKQILKFWKLGGMALINDMYSRAQQISVMQQKINDFECQIEQTRAKTQEEINDILSASDKKVEELKVKIDGYKKTLECYFKVK